MKNNLSFAALTFAFTVAGSCIGATLVNDPGDCAMVTLVIATIGAFAAALCGTREPL